MSTIQGAAPLLPAILTLAVVLGLFAVVCAIAHRRDERER